jgi:hypothetical protein
MTCFRIWLELRRVSPEGRRIIRAILAQEARARKEARR